MFKVIFAHLKALSLLLVFVSLLSLAQGQSFGRGCPSSHNCVPLTLCPSIVELIRSGSLELQRKARDAICGFRNGRPLVCCPSTTRTTTQKPFVIGNNPKTTRGGASKESLLPGEGTCGRTFEDDRIINGKPAPLGSYPWLVAMGYSEVGKRKIEFHCSGSVINYRYVLTAAHCVHRRALGRKKLEILHLGDWDLSTEIDCQLIRNFTSCGSKHVASGFEDIVIHPQYDKRGRSSDDIALIRLNMTIEFDVIEAHVQPICLPPPGINVEDLSTSPGPIAAGWGLTEHGNSSNIMLRVYVPIVDNEKCVKRYGSDFVGQQLCVGGEGGFDTCSGDSGGPLIGNRALGPPFYQIGIVSFGPFPCGLSDFPGVYTDVKEYRNWIVENLRP